MTVGLATAVTVGFGFTVTATVLLFEQVPFAPVTVYIVLVAGVTVTVPPMIGPGNHVYVVAPLALNVNEVPAQTTVGVANAVTVGFEFTVRETVLVFEQVPLEPVTV